MLSVCLGKKQLTPELIPDYKTMNINTKYLSVWAGIAVMIMLCFVSCTPTLERFKLLPTPVPATPTPHYTPMTGQAYIAPAEWGEQRLWKTPGFPRLGGAAVLSGTQVNILESVWQYSQFKYVDVFCYRYLIEVPNTGIRGWIDQEGITQEMGKEVPREYFCDQRQPALLVLTPSYIPLTGTVYVNTGTGNGVAVTQGWDPRIYTTTILSHGSRVDILWEHWVHFEATEEAPEISCYLYVVSLESRRFVLPEDVLAYDLTQSPNRRCFPEQTPPAIFTIMPSPPDGFEIFGP